MTDERELETREEQEQCPRATVEQNGAVEITPKDPRWEAIRRRMEMEALTHIYG